MQGAARQKRVTNDFVQDFIAGVPSCDEQKTISSFEYLQEYRTALISEVVTGKIDVKEG